MGSPRPRRTGDPEGRPRAQFTQTRRVAVVLPGQRCGQGAGGTGEPGWHFTHLFALVQGLDWQGKGKYRLLLGALGPVSLKCFGVPGLFPSIAKAVPRLAV